MLGDKERWGDIAMLDVVYESFNSISCEDSRFDAVKA